MTRPSRLPLLARTLTYRQEPPSGTLFTGWGSHPFASKHANWTMGLLGDWATYLDYNKWSIGDEWENRGEITLVLQAGLSFAIGGPLSQRPLTGGIYIYRSARYDLSVTGALAPLYVFRDSTTNYVFVHPSTTRDSYPDIVVSSSNIPPVGGLWVLVRIVTTSLTAVLTDSAPAGQLVGFYRRGQQNITGSGNATTLTIECNQSIAPGVLIKNGPGASNTLVQLLSNVNQLPISVAPNGNAIAGMEATISVTRTCGWRAISSVATTDTVGFVQTVPSASSAFAVAMSRLSAVPANGVEWTDYCRLFATFQLPSGGLRWRDGTGTSAKAWTPHAHRGDITTAINTVAADVALAPAVGPVSLVTRANVDLLQGHLYLVSVDCEATILVGVTFTQSVTILINGVAHPDWNARLFTGTRNGLTSPWLSTTLHYVHTAADALNVSIVLQVTHGGGASAITYVRPRIYVFGPFSIGP